KPCKPLYMFVACGTTIVLSAESSRPDVRVTPVFSHTPWGSTQHWINDDSDRRFPVGTAGR
ncbi:MAG: hypothetical protein ACTSPE_11065, partial [Candidatus Thorarchaeota archaeon]